MAWQPTTIRRPDEAFGVRRQSAAATALWLAPEGRANSDLRHVLRIQSGVALRFPPHSKTRMSPFAGRFVIVVNLQLVDLEAVDRPHLRRGSGALEPRRRTPRILIGHRHQPMLHRILMNVIESRTIGLLVREACLPKVVLDRPVARGIETIEPLGSLFVKESEHGPQAGRVLLRRWRVCDEVIMVRKHGPSFELPAKVARHGEQTSM